MSRKTTRSYASFLRAWGNDRPEHGFDLAELVQPVVIVDDATPLARRYSGATVITRLYRAALAGSFSCAAISPGPGGVHIKKLEAEGNIRIMSRTDTDGITANRAIIQPPVGFMSNPPMTSVITVGTAVADPNPATEFLQLIAADRLEDILVPPNTHLIITGIAANLIVTAHVHYVEGVDA